MDGTRTLGAGPASEAPRMLRESGGAQVLTRREALGAAVAAVAAVIAGCFSDRPSPTDGSGGDVVVEMKPTFVFDPATVTIRRGQTIAWRNTSEGVVHTTTADADLAHDPADVKLPSGAQPWDSGAIAPGQEYRRTFDVAGEYHYFCKPHETLGMLGTIIVQP